ncbi:hypothetical protein ACWC09_05350 [Streptomyces sp. NPDC001617]
MNTPAKGCAQPAALGIEAATLDGMAAVLGRLPYHRAPKGAVSFEETLLRPAV